VVAACHVLTALALAGPSDLLERARRTIRVGNGIGMVVRLATSGLPRYPAAGEHTYRSLQLIAPSRPGLRGAYGDFSAGLPPREPAVVAMTFSAFDETLAPAGKHNVTVWGQWHPYELSNGEDWDGIGEREATKLVEAVDRVAPGFASCVEQMYVQTPLDLERELGLLRGQVMHADARAGRVSRAVAARSLPVRCLDPSGRRGVRCQRAICRHGGPRRPPPLVRAVAHPKGSTTWLRCTRCCSSTAERDGTQAG
jgi:phytoene dehydrogenase-like protein